MTTAAKKQTMKKEEELDAIELLTADHLSVEALFQRFEKLGESATAARKKDIVQKITRALSIHAAIEEEILYPAIRETIPAEESQVAEGLEEHRQVKIALAELERARPGDDDYDTEVLGVIEDVRHHVEEEEEKLFPRLRQKLPEQRLYEMAGALRAAKKIAPTHPHPDAPDEPPANIVAGAMMGAVDRARDMAPMPVRTVIDLTMKVIRIEMDLARRIFPRLPGGA